MGEAGGGLAACRILGNWWGLDGVICIAGKQAKLDGISLYFGEFLSTLDILFGCLSGKSQLLGLLMRTGGLFSTFPAF